MIRIRSKYQRKKFKKRIEMCAKSKIAALTALLTIIATVGWAQQITVSPDGEITSIREGIERSEAGDTLKIKRGTYAEYDIKVDKPLTILGEEGVIIDGEQQGFI